MAKVTKQFQYGAHTVILETGEIARQADGAVMVSVDGTVADRQIAAEAPISAGMSASISGFIDITVATT